MTAISEDPRKVFWLSRFTLIVSHSLSRGFLIFHGLVSYKVVSYKNGLSTGLGTALAQNGFTSIVLESVTTIQPSRVVTTDI